LWDASVGEARVHDGAHAIAGTVALLLGMVGIYGVMSYIVTQRTGEIGVRVALGADPRSVARLIVRQGGLVAVAGIAVGLGAALAGSRVIESLASPPQDVPDDRSRGRRPAIWSIPT